jgi:hypothetical protein
MANPPKSASLADQIRRFAFENYVVPTHAAPNTEIRIRAGDVHKAMRLSGRMPAVCGALDSIIFRREFGLELVQRSGPPQGANVEFRFRPAEAKGVPVGDPNATELATRTPASAENNGSDSLPRPATAKQRFTLKGETFEMDRDAFIRPMIKEKPGRIQKYSTIINGERYPIRQVVSSATGLPPIAITSQEAYRILEKFKFVIDIQE